jgi:hypothetical protein
LWTCHLGTPCVASCSQPTSIVEELLYLLIKTEKCYTEKN